MRRTLIDNELEAKFQKDGYVEVPFLTAGEIEMLKTYYFDTLTESGGRLGPQDEKYQSNQEITYDFTFIDKNSDYKQQVFDTITEAFKNRVDDYGEVRGPMIKSELAGIQQEIIEQFMVPIETKAGNCVILDDSIVHYSSPNHTDGLRLAIQLILIPAEENSIHYHMDLSKDRSLVEVLEVDHDFYMKFNPWKKPAEDVKRLHSFRYEPFDMTIEEFAAKLKQPRFDEVAHKPNRGRTETKASDLGFWSKLKSTFSKA